MPLNPAIAASVTITAKDINGNNIAKSFTQVGSMQFDYNKGMIRIIDLAQGEFYFGIMLITSLTYTALTGNVGQPVHTAVMS